MEKVTAKLNSIRIAPRKTRLVVDMIKGLSASEAINQLETTIKRSAPEIKKLVESAVSNAENNFGFDKTNLYISDARVEAGATMKRWMPKAFGRAGRILKRSSRIEVVLSEIVEGKGRKSKEQMEEEKKKRIEERKKAEKQQEKNQETEKKEENAKGKKAEKKEGSEIEKASGKMDAKGNWKSRIFRRKSM